ncbi:MAG: MBL fold metallo-hydrolase [Spirochaetales bacterium]
MQVRLTLVDAACVLLELGALRVVTDPVLDAPGRLYHHGWGAASRKTGSPPNQVLQGGAEVLLLSHHQHHDNFDAGGRAFAQTVPLVLSTPAAARALPGVVGLAPWQTYAVETPLVPGLRVTATPAQHRPGWLPEFLSGPVTGFVLEWEGQTDGVLYLTGDTVYFAGIDQVAQRWKIGTLVANVGSAQFRYLTGPGRFTMNARDLLRAVEVLKPARIFPIHHSGWSHFREQTDALKKALEGVPSFAAKTIWLEPGRVESEVIE